MLGFADSTQPTVICDRTSYPKLLMATTMLTLIFSGFLRS